MRSNRRMLIVPIVGILVSVGGAVWLERSQEATASDSPILEVVKVPGSTTSTTATAEAPAAGSQPKRRAPVAPPRDEYAPEPVVQIGSIEIPKIGLTHPIYHGITMRNIDRGPSHWPGTAFPGESGNTVFAGHRVTHSHPFRNIDKLVPGDKVHFTVNGIKSNYVVTGSEIVTPKALHIADPTPTPTATLFACHPPGSARYRYVVRLALLED